MKTEDLSLITHPYRNPNPGAAGQGRSPSLNGELSDVQDGQQKRKTPSAFMACSKVLGLPAALLPCLYAGALFPSR